jgi:ribonuclease P protein component
MSTNAIPSVHYTLKKSERLSGQKRIRLLLTHGFSLVCFPYLVYWIYNESKKPKVRFGVSIPKKKIKLAVKRNLLKRRTREVFRLNKSYIYKLVILESAETKKTQAIDVFLIYLSDQVLPYSELEQSFKKIINYLSERNQGAAS